MSLERGGRGGRGRSPERGGRVGFPGARPLCTHSGSRPAAGASPGLSRAGGPSRAEPREHLPGETCTPWWPAHLTHCKPSGAGCHRPRKDTRGTAASALSPALPLSRGGRDKGLHFISFLICKERRSPTGHRLHAGQRAAVRMAVGTGPRPGSRVRRGDHGQGPAPCPWLVSCSSTHLPSPGPKQEHRARAHATWRVR